MFDNKLEVFNTVSDKPVSTVTTDVNFNCMEFVSETEIIVADVNGQFTFVKNIQEEIQTTITLIKTKISRFRDIKCQSNTLVTVSTEGKLSFFDVAQLRAFHLEIGSAKAVKQIKSKSRFLCLAINHMQPDEEKNKKKMLKKKNKKLGKKITKDEKIILKRQKKSAIKKVIPLIK